LNGFRTGGNGGFGGGGASGHNASLQTGGGVGGFGGGGGVGDTFNGGSIFGGGQASAGTGGGGAAFGGAIFVANGATLTLSGAVNIAASPNTIVAGTVGSSLARGQDIFLVSSGTINFNHTNTVTIGTAIESNNGFGGVGNTTTGGIIMSGSGILDLTGNTGAVLPFTGSTAFNAGTTKVSSDANLGRSSNTMSFNGGTLEFTTAFTTSRTITLTGSGTVNTNAVNPTFSGNIGGSGGLTKTGAGILTLSGASNTFSGGLTINAGTLALGSTSINAAGSVNVNASGAAFDISGAGGNVTIGSLSGVSGGLVHLGARTLTFGTSSSTSFLGNIDGTGGLSKQGSGTVTLSGTNTYSGGTQLMQGTLAVGSNSALGTGTLTFNTNNGNILQAGAVGLSFSNAISLLANGVVDTNGQALTLSGAISNSGSLTKTGSGTLTLSGTNSYSGGSIINAGTLALASTSSISATGSVNVNASGAAFDISGAGGNITIGDLSGTSGSLIHLGARTLTFGTGNSTSFLGNIDGTGGVIKQGSGSVTLSGTSSYNGGTQLSEGTLSVGNNSVLGTGTLTFNTNNGNILQAAAAGLTLSNAISLSTNATVDTNGQSLTLSGAISNTGSLTKVGSGTLTLSGANSYSGGTIINAGAVALGSTSINAAGSVNANASGTTFDISGAGGNITIGDLSGALGSVLQLGARTLTFGTGNSTSFLGNIDGTGGITKQGSGTVTLSGSNSYSGGTELNLGTIAIETGTALGTGTLTFGNVDGNILQTAASMTLSNSIGLAKNGVIDTTNQILMMGGPITGPGGLNKMGSGQIILTGIHSYVGPTTVSAGTLTINGSITSPTTVLPSAALNGNGTITGDVVIGGLLGPGEEIGTIEIVGNVTFQSGSTFQVEADPTKADLLDVDASGNITIQPAATLEIVPTPGSYGTNTTYNIAYAGESGGIIIGTFDNIVNTYPLITAQVFYGTAASVSLTDTAAGINQMSLVLNFAPISSVVTTGNAGSIASSLDGVTPALDSDLYLVLQQLYFLPTDQALEDALNQMQPSILNTISLAQQNSSLFVSTAVAKHTADLRESNSPCTETGDKKWQIWGDGSIDWARQRGNHQNVGFHSQAELGAGGIDYRISRQFYVGVLGAYTHTSIHCHDHLAKGRVNTYYTGLYSSWLNSRFFANASVMGSFSDYHSKRKVQFGSINRQPKGHHHGSGVIAHLDLGASLPKESRVQCYPYGALDYVYQHEKGYTETKAQSLDVNIRSRNLNMLRSELGLQGRLCRSFKRNVFIPSGRLGWVYEKRFQGKKMNARLVDVPNRFTVNGLYPNRSMLAAGAAVTVVFNEIAHLSIAYEGLFGSGYISNAGNILLNIQF
jgi:autotransporter-associated beta strand protein